MQPTQLRHFLEPVDNSRYVGVINADRIASRANHRLYRQGRNYCVRVNLTPSSTASYAVLALRDDWMIHNAWKYAFQTYMNNSKEELEALGKNAKARWSDFRVESGVSGTPTEIQGTQFDASGQNWLRQSSGEFVNSEVHDEAGNAITFGFAPSATRFNILTEYQRTANTSSDPTTPEVTAGYRALDDDLQSGQLEHLGDAGNLPPYHQTSISDGNPWVLIAELGTNVNGGQTLSTGYFNAPCGLVLVTKIDNFSIQDSATLGMALPIMSLDFKPGNYKGVHAPSMGTAKLVKNHYEVK